MPTEQKGGNGFQMTETISGLYLAMTAPLIMWRNSRKVARPEPEFADQESSTGKDTKRIFKQTFRRTNYKAKLRARRDQH